jgi:uncharacterized membrane protein YfcA
LNYIIIFFISILTSAASATAGLGGGLLLIPFIVLVFGIPVKHVAGTMLFAMIPYTAVATIKNVRNGYVNFKIGLTMEIGSMAGVLAGAYFSETLPDYILKLIFLTIAIYLLFSLKLRNDSPYNYIARGFKIINFIPPFIRCETTQESRCSIPSLISVGIVAGFFAGLLGIGGGFLKTPVLIVGVTLPPKIAVGTAIFMILITSSIGSIEHFYLNHIIFSIALVITAGMVIGAYIGSSILKKLPEQKIRTFLFIMIAISAVLLFFRT